MKSAKVNQVVDVEPLLAQLLDMYADGTVDAVAFARYVVEAAELPSDIALDIGRSVDRATRRATITYLADLGLALTPEHGPRVSIADRQAAAVKAAVPYRFDDCLAVLCDLRWTGGYVEGGTVREVSASLREELQNRTRVAVSVIIRNAERDGRIHVLG